MATSHAWKAKQSRRAEQLAWRETLDQVLDDKDRRILSLVARGMTNRGCSNRLGVDLTGFKDSLYATSKKLAPITTATPVRLTRTGMTAIFVYAYGGTMRSPWKEIAEQLTHVERRVVTYVALGLTNAEIGEQLSLSPLTIKSHLQRIGHDLKPFTDSGKITRINRTTITVICVNASITLTAFSLGYP